jgi:hypothetical protein
MKPETFSKPLKPWPELPTTWCGKAYEKMTYPLRRVRRFFSVYRERISRCWAYARFAWKNYDFDGEYLVQLMTFKLKRIQRSLQSGCSIQDKKYMQALRLAVRLGDKLKNYDYHWFMDCHNKKWGEPDVEFEDCDDETSNKAGLKRMEMRRVHVVDEATKEQERREFMVAYEADDAIQDRDSRLFFRLIEKYYPGWWD